MSLTGTHHVFASVDEEGVNDLARAFFAARPHYLHYGSVPFVAASTVTATQIAPISFPYLPGGIAWRVDFAVPAIDLFPQNGPLPPPLALGPDQFSVRTRVRLTIGCGSVEQDSKLIHVKPVSTALDIWAVGKLIVHDFGGGNGEIRLEVDGVEIVDIQPQSLEDVLNCLLKMLLQAALSNFRIPFHVLSAGFVQLTIEAGPSIADNQVEAWGRVT